ncbi:hypothetical protein LG347_03225 [Lactiplantibacillus plantarum]|uniref:hypothetical protein n=1 Tax=Lactiplantibacillus plantarum TaxID=1590 RepID=UPI0007E42132|nr:hypothetical protein [Lactiplantibacillus plantarum]ANI94437.1 hypothetical protein A9F05_01710 [Lactiplantibacillus plantarum]AYG28654.1 hypothetical protein CFI62_11990 [Lactiplantibacillus plantarum]MCB7140032.1 hypothetical protein [Lactiplantibacillus plantarum]MCB7156274.1 hypothetical protein [Lactiplantibacillus plantarum]MCB7165883.1 hypothetical protein [Lactiplantibacillus plantarum]
MDKMTVQQAIEILSMQFPISWEKIANKPDLVTSDDLDQRLSLIGRLTSPDGTAWVPSIDNDGKVIWKKVKKEEEDGNTTGNE